MLTYKFRLYPTKTQEKKLEETFETCRRLYNRMLDDRLKNHTAFFEQKKKLVELKKEDKYLKEVHSQVLQDVVLRLDKAFESYFAGLSKFPRFKRKGRYNSFTYPQHEVGFRLIGNRIKLGMIGKIKMRIHRVIEGKIKTATIIRDVDQWFVALSVSIEKQANNTNTNTLLNQNAKAIGVDLGITNAIALSDGALIQGRPKFLRKAEERIKKLQKILSRKKRGSKRGEKSRILLAKAWRKVRRQRDDFAHKVSNKLAKEYGTIVFEDLSIRGMVKNHSLASSIMDACWGKLRQFTVYKAERCGGRVILVNPAGTSQKCSGCGEMVQKPLFERIHICPKCGLVLDRDVNAARNILAAGVERALAEAEPLLFRRRISKFGQGSEKPTGFSRG
jgi:putative transposase